ncbi:thioesterase family protein [Hymenobacter algoricola]|uniref:Thioesterase family protein n=2 Tax=Hymenobacter algoricola TaxID=486267 RepID=A0ABP7MCC8_9BACT
MARIKILLPHTFALTIQLPVRITDLNYGGHLGNDALLSLLHEARVQFLRHLGLQEVDPATGLGTIMADVAIEYKGEAFYGDVLQVQLAATELHKYGFDVVYWVKNQVDKEIARAKTGMLLFDYNTRKLRVMEPAVAGQLGREARP